MRLTENTEPPPFSSRLFPQANLNTFDELSCYCKGVQTIKKQVLVTGAAGFIGGSVMHRLLSRGLNIHGVDNFSNYYNPKLKQHHMAQLSLNSSISDLDICDYAGLSELYTKIRPDVVIHLAAQGGVRASENDPIPYIQTNQMGFYHLLQLNNKFNVGEFIYASSSSVYGEGLPVPFRENMLLPAPKSLYAASKLADELMSENYPIGQNQKRIGLRFFTVYGPWGRPDMAVSKLLASGFSNQEFTLTANSDLVRDFTYVEDVTDVIEDLIILDKQDFAPHTIFNVAGEAPRTMSELIEICHNSGFTLDIRQGVINKSDATKTHGSSAKLSKFGLRIPRTSLERGIDFTIKWFSDKENTEILNLLA
jgi:UDP-glucuronate 4-epimerase